MAGLRYLLLVMLGLVTASEAGRIFTPDQLRHKEHEPCVTHRGTEGRCERSCGLTSGTSGIRECGIKDSAFLYCCDLANSGNRQGTLQDISPPFTTFQCGINSRNEFFFDPYIYTPDKILRPESQGTAASPSSHINKTGPVPSTRPGIPEEAFIEFINDDTTLPDGVYSVAGGINAEKYTWPWMALVGEKTTPQIDGWFCGGVLINELWVLSALHCFLYNTAEVVRLGELDYAVDFDRANPQDFDVVETVLYPDYKHPQAYHDIALLKLASKVTIQKFMSPVCLPWGVESDNDITNQITTLTGWGDTSYGGFPSTILQEANVTVFSIKDCDQRYSGLPHYGFTWPQGIGEETLCAGDHDGGRDACQGDSGGPLVSRNGDGSYVLAGIVSRGYGCGHKDYPGLYANVRYPPYLAWIKKIAFT